MKSIFDRVKVASLIYAARVERKRISNYITDLLAERFERKSQVMRVTGGNAPIEKLTEFFDLMKNISNTDVLLICFRRY
jgi:hypothetical protein